MTSFSVNVRGGDMVILKGAQECLKFSLLEGKTTNLILKPCYTELVTHRCVQCVQCWHCTGGYSLLPNNFLSHCQSLSTAVNISDYLEPLIIIIIIIRIIMSFYTCIHISIVVASISFSFFTITSVVTFLSCTNSTDKDPGKLFNIMFPLIFYTS